MFIASRDIRPINIGVEGILLVVFANYRKATKIIN
jgi:hypothetical protein